MARLWTFSGINSPRDGRGGYLDYVGEELLARMPDLTDIERRYASRLGTGRAYDATHNVLRGKAAAKLNREAREMAAGRIDPRLEVVPGAFAHLNLRLILIAPKTGTRPPDGFDGDLEIYWGAYDPIPNQGIFRPDSLTYWRKWSNRVWPVRRGHALQGFLEPGLKVAKRVRQRRFAPAGPRYRYIWIDTPQPVPFVLDTLRKWREEDDQTLILFGHSQGTNIAMHALKRGWPTA